MPASSFLPYLDGTSSKLLLHININMNRAAKLLKPHRPTQDFSDESYGYIESDGLRPALTEVYRGDNPVVE